MVHRFARHEARCRRVLGCSSLLQSKTSVSIDPGGPRDTEGSLLQGIRIKESSLAIRMSHTRWLVPDPMPFGLAGVIRWMPTASRGGLDEVLIPAWGDSG